MKLSPHWILHALCLAAAGLTWMTIPLPAKPGGDSAFTAPDAVACIPPPSGLVSWWRAEDTAADALGGNTGVLLNGTSFASGAVGQGFQFNGVNQAVLIPHATNLISSNFTVEAWVYPARYGNDALVFGQNAGECQLLIRPATTGFRAIWQFGTGYNSYYVLSSSNQIPVGQFSHIAASWDGIILRVFLNGILDGQRLIAAKPLDPGCPFYIGGFYSPGADSCAAVGEFFNGVIDEVSFFNRALSPQEIAALYVAGNAGKCPPDTNHAPVAVMAIEPLTDFCGVTNLVVVAPDDQAAVVVLDGSLSSDPDGDPLEYAWLDGTNEVGADVLVTESFAVGTHDLTLVVSDGALTGTDSKTVEVITRAQSIALIMEMVEQSDLRRQTRRPLMASLRAAAASFARGNPIAAVHQLGAFKNKLNAQVAPANEALADCLRDAADTIIGAGLQKRGPARVR